MRQHEIEQHEVKGGAEGQLQAFVTIPSLKRRVTGELERIQDAATNRGVVFNNEDGGSHGGRVNDE